MVSFHVLVLVHTIWVILRFVFAWILVNLNTFGTQSVWSGSFDFVPERKIYLLITWTLIPSFNTIFLIAQTRNHRKNSCFCRLWWLTSCKISTSYSCAISPHSCGPFHSSHRISFCWWYTIKLKRSSWPSICTSECCTIAWNDILKIHRY